jgi:hypothetical protein
MPARYRIFPDLGLVYSDASGVLSADDMIAHVSALASDRAFSPTFAQLTDLRPVTGFAAGAVEMQRVARANPFDLHARRVAIVGSALAYGMMRMYQLMTDTEDSGTLVTRDAAEAWAHVGRDPEVLQRAAASVWSSTRD